MSLYPIHLDLQGKRCVVVGAGRVAERKTRSLQESGALVQIIAPEATPTLACLARSGEIAWTRAEYEADYLENVFLVIAATDHPEVNEAVAQDAAQRGLLVCRADDWRGGNFVSPAAISRGDLLVTIFTSGNPTLAAVLREDLETMLGSEWNEMTVLFGRLRSSIQAIGEESARRAAVRRVLGDQGVREALQSGENSEAEARARQCLSLFSE